jgi:hypothetical protein
MGDLALLATCDLQLGLETCNLQLQLHLHLRLAASPPIAKQALNTEVKAKMSS